MDSQVILLILESTAILLFAAYLYVVFLFSDRIFQKESSVLNRIAISVFNVILGGCFFYIDRIGSIYTYVFFYLLIYAEFYLLYQQKWNRKLLIVTIFISHIIVVRTIVLSFFSLNEDIAIEERLLDLSFFVQTNIITLLILTVAVLFVMKIIPVEKIHLVIKRDDQTFFLLIWVSICMVYLVINSEIYVNDLVLQYADEDQILKFITIIIGIYIIIFYSLSNSQLLSIKSKNEELQAEIKKQEDYREAILGEAKYSFEANLSKNIITKGFQEHTDLLKTLQYNYEKVLYEICQRIVYDEDIEQTVHFLSINQLLMLHQQGLDRHELEFRLKDGRQSYYWGRAVIHIRTDVPTNDILLFAYLLDIDSEKREELLLKDRAEKDGLTGLYNKVTTEYLISEKLKSKQGILFIIDVDNFKSINDYFGHAKGDDVLRLLASELSWIFREKDIIGRIGGDEFIAFLEISYNEQLAYKKAGEILRRFYKVYVDSKGQNHIISASIGISRVTDEKMSFAKLYRQADVALYHAKNEGKNTVYIYDGTEFEGYHSNREKK